MTVFGNHEMLVEIEEEATVKRMLALPNAFAAYEGLAPGDDVGIPGKNPFMMADMAFYPVVATLTAAFPLGIEGVPMTRQDFNVIVDGRSMSGHAQRTSESMIRYHITLTAPNGKNGERADFDGIWQKSPVAPLPDELSLDHWQVRRKDSSVPDVATIGSMRRLSEQQLR